MPVEAEMSALLFGLDRLDQRTHTILTLEFGATDESLLIGGGLNRFIVTWFHADGASSTLWKEATISEELLKLNIGAQIGEFDPLIVLARKEARQALRDLLNDSEPTSDLCWLKD